MTYLLPLDPQMKKSQLNGQFDFNFTPLAPPGTRSIIYEGASECKSWYPHGVDAWYVASARKHYQCYIYHVPVTGGERITKSAKLFPKTFTVPKLSSADAATIAANDLIEALKNPAPAAPYQSLSNQHHTILKQWLTSSTKLHANNTSTF